MNNLATIAAGAEAVPHAVKECLVDPFVAAVRLTFTEMAGTDLVVQGTYLKPRVTNLGDLSAMIRYSSSDGAFILAFPRPTALAVSKRILANLAEAHDEGLMCDCLGEIANVVAGQAKALLAGSPFHFAFTTPNVINGPIPDSLTNQHRDCLVVVLHGELGEFALQLWTGSEDKPY